MKFYLFLIPIFLLAILQGAFLPLNLVLWMVLFLAVTQSNERVNRLAFFSGLFLDLAKGTPLGLSSLLLLLTSYFVFQYARRFDPAHPLFLPLVVLSASIIFNFILEISVVNDALVLTALAFFSRPLVKYFRPVFDRDQLKLKL